MPDDDEMIILETDRIYLNHFLNKIRKFVEKIVLECSRSKMNVINNMLVNTYLLSNSAGRIAVIAE